MDYAGNSPFLFFIFIDMKTKIERSKPFDPKELCKILESVAKKYESTSIEYAAVELAAFGMLYLHSAMQGPSFVQYLKRFALKQPEFSRACENGSD